MKKSGEEIIFVDPSSFLSGLELKPEEKKVLEEVNGRIASGLSVSGVMDYLFESTRSVFPCDRLGLALLEDEGRLVSWWNRADYEGLILGKGYAEDIRGGSLEELIESGKPRIINDLPLYLEKHPQSRSSRLLVDEGVRSSLTCPLSVDGRRIGVMFRSSRECGAYDSRQVYLHLKLAERLSQAVEKVRLIEELRRTNEAYMEMLAFVSHELKNPLASIIMDASVLTGGYVGSIDEKVREKIEKISFKAGYLNNLVREYLDLAGLEGGSLKTDMKEGVNLHADILEPAFELVASQVSEKKMKVEWNLSEPVYLSCDPGLLRIVAVNLIGNAAKYGREGGRIRIHAGYEKRGADYVVMRVWNEGPGFPEEQRARLFRRFSRINTPELMSRRGSGIGLYTSWRIARLHGGMMDAKSVEGEWAEFLLYVRVNTSPGHGPS